MLVEPERFDAGQLEGNAGQLAGPAPAGLEPERLGGPQPQVQAGAEVDRAGAGLLEEIEPQPGREHHPVSETVDEAGVAADERDHAGEVQAGERAHRQRLVEKTAVLQELAVESHLQICRGRSGRS